MHKNTYPQPGTHAATIRDYIANNPGTTANGIISALKMNPSVVRKCLAILLERGAIKDAPDANRYHHFEVVTIL